MCLSFIFDMGQLWRRGSNDFSLSVWWSKTAAAHVARVRGKEQGTRYLAHMGKCIGPTPECAERKTLISILAHNQVGRHWVYSGHYPRIFVAPKNTQNVETKRWSGAVPILLLALSALATSAYTSLGVLQELNPQPQLLKASGLPLSHISCALSVLLTVSRRVNIKCTMRLDYITAAAKKAPRAPTKKSGPAAMKPGPANKKAPPAPAKMTGLKAKMRGPTNKGQKWGHIFCDVDPGCPSPPAIKSAAEQNITHNTDSDDKSNNFELLGHTFCYVNLDLPSPPSHTFCSFDLAFPSPLLHTIWCASAPKQPTPKRSWIMAAGSLKYVFYVHICLDR